MTRAELAVPTQARSTAFPPIAFCGRAGAGKTTCADVLVKEHGYTRMSFASPLKQCAELIWGPDALTDRRKLQELGVAVREIEEDSWVAALTRHINDTVAFVVNDDLRFPNEYWALKELGFVIVRVQAQEILRVARLKSNGKFQNLEQLEHISETAIDDLPVDYVISNETDIYDLTEDINAILSREASKS